MTKYSEFFDFNVAIVCTIVNIMKYEMPIKDLINLSQKIVENKVNLNAYIMKG